MLDIFLLNYWATPHEMAGASPAKIMFGREIRPKLPEFSQPEQSDIPQNALACDEKNKIKMQQYHDNRNKSASTTVSVGDTMLLRQRKHNKLAPTFDPKAYRVVKRQGGSVTLQRGNEPAIMRNVSMNKKIDNVNVHEAQRVEMRKMK